MIVSCEFCGVEINTAIYSHCVKVTGWAKTKNGKQTNTITRASAPLGYACIVCVERGSGPPESFQQPLF